MNEVVAWCRGIIVEVHLQTAELIQEIVDFAVEGSDVRRFGRLLTGRGDGEGGGGRQAGSALG